jgi:gliding motility-associated lipoprotein GldH
MIRSLCIALCVVLLLSSCEDDPVFEEYQSVESGTWNQNDTKTFQFEVKDTIALYDFFVNLRHGSDYPYSNMYVFVTLNYPNGKVKVDTVECPVAQPDGKWIGSGLGDLYDLRVRFWNKRTFPISGEYSVSINQAMREEDLPSVFDVGFRIEKGI